MPPMPAMIRIGGKMWGADGHTARTPRRSSRKATFARIYQEIINFCKTQRRLDR